MPTCPGCQQQVAHLKLPVHTQFCEAIYGKSSCNTSVLESLDARLSKMERQLDARLALIEAELDAPIPGAGRLSSTDLR